MTDTPSSTAASVSAPTCPCCGLSDRWCKVSAISPVTGERYNTVFNRCLPDSGGCGCTWDQSKRLTAELGEPLTTLYRWRDGAHEMLTDSPPEEGIAYEAIPVFTHARRDAGLDERADAVIALAEKATPGGWRVESTVKGRMLLTEIVHDQAAEGFTVPVCRVYRGGKCNHIYYRNNVDANSAFIAAAHEAVSIIKAYRRAK